MTTLDQVRDLIVRLRGNALVTYLDNGLIATIPPTNAPLLLEAANALDALSSIPEQGVGVTGDAKEIADRLRNAAPKMDANWGRLALDGAMMIEYLFGKAALAPSQPAAVGVTDEMVEAIVQAVRPYTLATLFLDEHRDLVRAALRSTP